MATAAWDPWEELRRRPHLFFKLAHLDGMEAAYVPRGRRAAVIVHTELGRRARAAALGHELVHDERGGGCGCSPLGAEGWQYVCSREERAVDRIVAERMLDGGEVLAFAQRRAEFGEPTTVVDVAEEFDVAEWVAALRLQSLHG
jgi:hypothetical protein